MLQVCTLALVLAHGPATTAPHTVVPPMFYSEIVQSSEQILVGTVTGSKCVYERGKETIVTLVTLQQLTVHKGKVGASVTLRFEGGSIGEDHLRVPLMPNLVTGRRYLLHINGLTGKKVSPIVGFYQGALEIRVEAGQEILRNTFGEALVGIQNDRFVFATQSAPKPVIQAPEAVATKVGFKPAHPDADAIEAAQQARRIAAGEAQQQPLPVVGYGSGNVPGPASEGGSDAAHRIQSNQSRRNAAPIVLPADKDTGIRMSSQSLMAAATEVK